MPCARCISLPAVQFLSLVYQVYQVYPVRPALSHVDFPSALLELVETLEPGVTKDLFQSFSVCGSCAKWKRLGELNDGGYLVCMDHLEKSELQGAYSMGVEHHDQWSLDVYKTFQIPIFQYDCTVSGPAQNCDECYFFQACLKGKDDEDPFPGKRSWTLAEAVAESKQATAKERSLLLKMDIEGGEWPTLAGSDLETLKKFRQLVIEFHDLENEETHELYLQVMQKLLKAGFKVVHVHGNNYAGVYEKDQLRLPNVVEVTLDAMAKPSSGCHSPTYEQLDMPNAPSSPEIRDLHTSDDMA